MKLKLMMLFLLISVKSVFAAQLTDFRSDGCSLSPDGVWAHCCVEHDLAYWQGGPRTERIAADARLRQCIAQYDPTIADIYFNAVRTAGSEIEMGIPSLAYFRWGYGWKNRKAYKALSTSERNLAKLLLMKYTPDYIQNILSDELALDKAQVTYVLNRVQVMAQ